MSDLRITGENTGGGGGLQVDPRQTEDDRHQHRPGSNISSQTGSIEASLSRKVPVKV